LSVSPGRRVPSCRNRRPFDPAPELADEDSVRCPSCNARLGLASDFRADPPNVEKLRARHLKKA
jgi:hypothetical protein